MSVTSFVLVLLFPRAYFIKPLDVKKSQQQSQDPQHSGGGLRTLLEDVRCSHSKATRGNPTIRMVLLDSDHIAPPILSHPHAAFSQLLSPRYQAFRLALLGTTFMTVPLTSLVSTVNFFWVEDYVISEGAQQFLMISYMMTAFTSLLLIYPVATAADHVDPIVSIFAIGALLLPVFGGFSYLPLPAFSRFTTVSCGFAGMLNVITLNQFFVKVSFHTRTRTRRA